MTRTLEYVAKDFRRRKVGQLPIISMYMYTTKETSNRAE